MTKVILILHCDIPMTGESFAEDDSDLIKDGKVIGKIISASRTTGRIKMKIPPWLAEDMRKRFGAHAVTPESN